MRIALCCSVKKSDPGKPPDYYSEFDSEETVLKLASSIQGLGHEVAIVESNNRTNLVNFFQNSSVDFVFNIAEGSGSRFRESEVPALLDFLGIPYTGSSSFTLALALNKAMAKRIFRYENIPTPNFQVFDSLNTALNPRLKFPLIVKPNYEGSGKGISALSVVNNEDGLYRQVSQTLYAYQQEVLVEEFIEGKELTVGILANGNVTVLPILEIDFSDCTKSGEFFYSWRMKEFQGNNEMGLSPKFYCPARLCEEVTKRVKETALKAHKALGCLDISRTDIRLGKDNIPYVLEVNPLPGLDPDESNFPMIAKAYKMEYRNLIKTILESAMERYEMAPFCHQKISEKEVQAE